jgi:hypothetical protein
MILFDSAQMLLRCCPFSRDLFGGSLAAFVSMRMLNRLARAAVFLCLAYPALPQSVCYSVFVDPASSAAAVSVGQPVTLTAAVTENFSGSRTPMGGGTVTFLDNGSVIAGSTTPVDVNGNASFVTSFNLVGNHIITAVSSWQICDQLSISSAVSVSVVLPAGVPAMSTFGLVVLAFSVVGCSLLLMRSQRTTNS